VVEVIGRVLRTGLSSFGSSLLRSLAGSRFNPSRGDGDYRRGYHKALDDALAVIELYGETNMEACGDGILMDPLLRGGEFTDENMALSRECSIMSTIHSAQYHAAEHLMEALRKLR
jgi:hypothetical protein